MNFVAVVRNFEVVKNKLFHFLEQIGYYYCLLKVSLEYLFFEGVIRVTVGSLKFTFEPGVDVKFAHRLNFGEVGNDRLQINFGLLFVFEEAVFYQCY